MALIEVDRNPSRRVLNGFGVMWLLFFGAVGALVRARTGSTALAAVVWAAAVAAPAAGWLRPSVMRVLYVMLSTLTLPIGWAASLAVLSAAYFLAVTPIGLAMRLCGRDPLRRRFEPEARTYWVKHKAPEGVERYFRPF